VHQGCFAFESNQTQKKQSLIDERLLFGCLLPKTKKLMQQATINDINDFINQSIYRYYID